MCSDASTAAAHSATTTAASAVMALRVSAARKDERGRFSYFRHRFGPVAARQYARPYRKAYSNARSSLEPQLCRERGRR
jgi:hypothetical protein